MGASPAPRGQRVLLAFVSFVAIQTVSQLLYKRAQEGGAYRINAAGSMVLAEGIKLAISLSFAYREATPLRLPAASMVGYACLALGYAANNQLTFVILKLANPGLLSLAKSCAPLLIAVTSALVFRERLSRLHWQCVVLQVCGMAAIFSRPVAAAGNDAGDDALAHENAGWLIVAACALTSGCSSLNAHLLHRGANVHVQNAWLYALGAVANACLFAGGGGPSGAVGLLAGYDSPWALGLLLSNALCGLVVTFLYRQSNAVVKTLASNVSSVLLVGVPALRSRDLAVLAGCGTILTTTVIYLEQPPVARGKVGEEEERRDGVIARMGSRDALLD